jgi:hypothetical protein
MKTIERISGSLSKHAASGLFTGIAALATASPLLATQSLWSSVGAPPGVQLELHRADLAMDGLGTLSGVGFVGGRLTASEGLMLVADVPFAYADIDPASDFAIGSPYIGIETSSGGSTFEAGIRLPLAGSGAGSFVGGATELVDRPGAFASNAFVANVAGNWGDIAPSGLLYRLRLGPRLLIPDGGGDLEVLFDYGAVVGLRVARFGIEGGINGWAVVTEDVDSLGDATVHQLGVEAYRHWSDGGRIGVLVRLPLDDDASALQDFSLGVLARLAL